MKAIDLINKLKEFEPNTEVCIGDFRKNLYHADDDGNGIGIYPDFKVEHLKEHVNKPFISLTFDNDDYTEDGELAEHLEDLSR